MPSELTPSGALLEERLAERLPVLLADVRDRLIADWPDYAAFLDADVDDIREGAAGMFLHRLVVLATSGPPDGASALESEGTLQPVFEQIGRRQWEVGHDLTRLLTAYQVGARVAWRHVAETAHELRLSPEAIALLAESVFDFVNHLSQASTTGYVLAQRDDARARDRHRAELTDLLLSPRSSVAAVRSAADKARWRLPSRMAVVLTDGEDALGRLDPAALRVRQGDLIGAILPDPDGPRRERLRRALSTTTSVVGMTVGVDLVARSVELAQIALGLATAGVLRERPLFVDEHLDTIIVHRDDRLLSFLRQQVLSPLEGLPAGSRERLTETLVSWLRHQGDRTAVAAELHVHPQTVSYRLGRLRELFGGALDDPRERSRLLLALNW